VAGYSRAFTTAVTSTSSTAPGAVLLVTGARLGQTYGYRRVFLLGAGLFTAASLLCGLAPTPIALILARVLQGFGAALAAGVSAYRATSDQTGRPRASHPADQAQFVAGEPPQLATAPTQLPTVGRDHVVR
jgi:MFS family permease